MTSHFRVSKHGSLGDPMSSFGFQDCPFLVRLHSSRCSLVDTKYITKARNGRRGRQVGAFHSDLSVSTARSLLLQKRNCLRPQAGHILNQTENQWTATSSHCANLPCSSWQCCASTSTFARACPPPRAWPTSTSAPASKCIARFSRPDMIWDIPHPMRMAYTLTKYSLEYHRSRRSD